MANEFRTLERSSNQARGLGQYAIDFLSGQGAPAEAVLDLATQFHLDSVACAVAAIAVQANAPRVLRREAMRYPDPDGAALLGSTHTVAPEKAVLANCAAVRELDANGTNFGYNPRSGAARGEFGHNDYYPVVLAAAGQQPIDGRQALLAMICLDEIRGRLAEVFALRDYRIDHVVHGAIASAAVYGALQGANATQIESAIGQFVAHAVPFRAIRAGHQLSDSKGASAAISSEMAVQAVHRAMDGFIGPADILRNPQAIFCLFEPPGTPEASPFDLELAMSGEDFAVMGMHFKLGIYEHQSAGAVAGLIQLLRQHPALLDDAEAIRAITIRIYEPALSIIGDPAKRDPRTRQSADHSMVYIVATLLRKALQQRQAGWAELMLTPADYDDTSLFHPQTRQLMDRIHFIHGGLEYDQKYPDGIPTTVEVEHRELGKIGSGLIMYPPGHARNQDPTWFDTLRHKFRALASLGVDDPDGLYDHLLALSTLPAEEVKQLYSLPIRGVR